MKQRYILLISLLTLLFIGGLHHQSVSAQGGLFPSLSAATTGTGASMPGNDAKQVGWYVEFSTGVSDGTVVIETAATKNYAGLWYELDRVSFTDLPSVPTVYFGTYPGTPVMFLRARIQATVVGGTVTAYLVKLPLR
jgi:hypothetical protein